jgi:hypothetical protein
MTRLLSAISRPLNSMNGICPLEDMRVNSLLMFCKTALSVGCGLQKQGLKGSENKGWKVARRTFLEGSVLLRSVLLRSTQKVLLCSSVYSFLQHNSACDAKHRQNFSCGAEKTVTILKLRRNLHQICFRAQIFAPKIWFSVVYSFGILKIWQPKTERTLYLTSAIRSHVSSLSAKGDTLGTLPARGNCTRYTTSFSQSFLTSSGILNACETSERQKY